MKLFHVKEYWRSGKDTHTETNFSFASARLTCALVYLSATLLTIFLPRSLIISVDDLRKLIEKSGQKLEASLFSESATLVATMDGEVSTSDSYDIWELTITSGIRTWIIAACGQDIRNNLAWLESFRDCCSKCQNSVRGRGRPPNLNGAITLLSLTFCVRPSPRVLAG